MKASDEAAHSPQSRGLRWTRVRDSALIEKWTGESIAIQRPVHTHRRELNRALTALDQMEDSDRQINFRTVAAEARVSAAWLYSQQELRTRIVRFAQPDYSSSSHLLELSGT